jgi:hypothetical protein
MPSNDQETTCAMNIYHQANIPCSPLEQLFDIDRQSELQEIRDGTYDWSHQPLWQNHQRCSRPDNERRKAIVTALCDDPYQDTEAAEIGLAILHCRKRYPCGSPLCDFCRTRCQDDREQEARRLFGHRPRQQLAFLTILTDVSYHPTTEVQARVDELRQKVRSLQSRPRFKDVRVFGAVEVDVKFPMLHLRRRRSKEVLEGLGMLDPQKEAYLVHLHAIVDLNGVSKDALGRWFRRSFPKKYQVRLAGLRNDHTTSTSVANLARYMLKFRAQEADNLWGNKPNGQAKYGSLYRDATLRSFVRCLHTIKRKPGFGSFYLTYNA